MAIRLLTAADAPQIQAIMDQAYPVHIGAARLFEPPGPGARDIVVGDPSVPALCKLVHYQLIPNIVAVMPQGLRQLLVASNGFASQITDFYPLSASDPAVSAQLLPFLATVLRNIVRKAPANMQATLAGRPIFARFDGVSEADGRALVAQFRAAFPNAGFAGRVIWHDTLGNARDAVAASAVDV